MSFAQKLKQLSEEYSLRLKQNIEKRMEEMKEDDHSHYLIYRVLGITNQEGGLIDQYQNKGRFLYKYAGSFLEEAAILCFEEHFKHVQRKIRISNTQGSRPKTFEIDCLVEQEAYEIKWRDATTDGDHIMKEHTRLKNIKAAGYKPVRIMFYYPNRSQAIKIQETLEAVYNGIGGEYYYGDKAWNYIFEKTKINLLEHLEQIAQENEGTLS